MNIPMAMMRNRRFPRLLSVVAAIMLMLGHASALAESADVLLNRYYEMQGRDDAEARAVLREAKARFPQDPRPKLEAAYQAMRDQHWLLAVADFEAALQLLPERGDLWAQTGYLYIRLGRNADALAAFRKAAAISPEHYEYRLQKAYLEEQAGFRNEALQDFHAIATTGGAGAGQACTAWQVLRQRRSGPDTPWFSEVYAAPEFRRHQAVTVLPVELRAGATVETERQLDLYGSLRTTWDNRSGHSDLGPQVYFDNVAIAAAGIRGRLFPDFPLTAFAEGGVAHDLSDREREADRLDGRTGLLLYQDWNMAPACGDWHAPFRFVADVYGDLVYYTRYGDLIGSLRLRPGLRVLESEDAAVDGYALLAGGADSQALSGNRYREAGLGMVLRVFDTVPMAVRGEAVEVWRSDEPRFSDMRLRLEYSRRF